MNIGLLMESSAWGGAEIHAVGLVRALQAKGHLATLVALSGKAHEVQRNRAEAEIPLDCLWIPKPPGDMSYLAWRRVFADQPWDVCMLIKGDIDSGGGWAIDLAARHTFGGYLVLEQKDADPIPPKASRLHFGFVPGLGLWWYSAHARRRLRSLGPQKIVCVSDANRRQLSSGSAYPEHKLVTVRNGIDVHRFRRNAAERRLWRDRWGAGAQSLVFGAVGRLHRIKGYDVALGSFAKLLARRPELDARLVLVGEGPEEQALRDRSHQIEPRGRVIFMPFQQKPEDVLSAFDAFVMPSVSEGLPLALAEAMACECCPIATNVGGIAEAIPRPDVGWLVPAGSEERFSDAMLEASARTAEELAAIGQSARALAMERFSADVQYAELIRLIESTAHPGRFAAGGGSQSDERVRQ